MENFIFCAVYEMLSNSINVNLNILIISETKLDSIFPYNQFTIKWYGAPLKFNRNARRGILLYIREDIQVRLQTISLPEDCGGSFAELNLRKKKILMCRSYNTANSNTSLQQHIISC